LSGGNALVEAAPRTEPR